MVRVLLELLLLSFCTASVFGTLLCAIQKGLFMKDVQ